MQDGKSTEDDPKLILWLGIAFLAIIGLVILSGTSDTQQIDLIGLFVEG